MYDVEPGQRRSCLARSDVDGRYLHRQSLVFLSSVACPGVCNHWWHHLSCLSSTDDEPVNYSNHVISICPGFLIIPKTSPRTPFANFTTAMCVRNTFGGRFWVASPVLFCGPGTVLDHILSMCVPINAHSLFPLSVFTHCK